MHSHKSKQLTKPSLLAVFDAKLNLCTWQYIRYNKNFNSIGCQTQTRAESSKYLEIANASLQHSIPFVNTQYFYTVEALLCVATNKIIKHPLVENKNAHIIP